MNAEWASRGFGHRRPQPAYDASGCLSIICHCCQRIVHALDAYRCFDCGVHLCPGCVVWHFSNRHEPHPLHLHEHLALQESQAARIAQLESDLARTERERDQAIDCGSFCVHHIDGVPTTDLNQLRMCYEAAEKNSDSEFSLRFAWALKDAMPSADGLIDFQIDMIIAWVKHPELVAQAILKAKGVS